MRSQKKVQPSRSRRDLEHVPDVVFSRPVSTAEEIAALILASALDGARERTATQMSKIMTNAGYLFPRLRQRLTPLLERMGRAAKERYRRREEGGTVT